MFKRFGFLIAFLVLFTVTACSLPTISQQGKAGVTDWHVTFNEETGQVEEARIIDGKEKANVTFEVDLKAGTAKYTATDVDAFKGQEIRGQTEREVVEDITGIIPEVTETVIDAIKPPGVPDN